MRQPLLPDSSMQEELRQLTKRHFDIGDVEVSHRPIIAWALNDRLEPGPLRDQLLSFKRAGYGGIMLQVWRGCPYDVMSDEWLEMVGFILHLAKEHDMEAWIWDDWVFPSGPAGGIVTSGSDDFKSRGLQIAVDMVLEPGETVEMRIPERALAAAVVPIDKFNNPRGAFKHFPAADGEIFTRTAIERERFVVVRWQLISAMQTTPTSQMECTDIYSSTDPHVFSVNMLNPAAVRRFLDVIHERYWEKFSDLFGATLKGFFYDEPGLPSLFPWCDGFADAFYQRKGYDLLPYLAPMLVEHKFYDIIFDLQSEDIKRVKADYMDVWTTMVADTFYGGLQAWCHEHHVACTGHQSNDESLKPVLSCTGQYFKNMFYNDMPGTDVVFNQLDPGSFIDFPRLAGSRASVLGRPASMSESFAVTGHGMDVDAMRYLAEHQIMRGVTKFFDMMANYNPVRGLYFHPPELSDVNVMMRRYGHHLHERMGNLSALMGSGEAPDKIALFVPMENFNRGESGIADNLDALARLLTYRQLEYDYIWDADLLSMTAIAGSLCANGGQRYSALLLPPGARLTEGLHEFLSDAASLGCQIVTWEKMPNALAPIGRLVADAGELHGLLADNTRPFGISPVDVPISQSRRIISPDRQLVFLLNESLLPQSLTLTIDEKWQLFEVDPESCEVYSCGDSPDVTISLEATESRLLLLAARGTLTALACTLMDATRAMTLDQWDLELPDGQSAQIGMPLPAWNALGYAEYHGAMRYRTTFSWNGDAPTAILDLGEVRYAATVYLDGEQVGDCVWTPKRITLHGLLPGEHRLDVEVVNTMANLVCGTEARYRALEESGVFRGTYSPIYIPRDRHRVISGLLGPVTLTPVADW